MTGKLSIAIIPFKNLVKRKYLEQTQLRQGIQYQNQTFTGENFGSFAWKFFLE